MIFLAVAPLQCAAAGYGMLGVREVCVGPGTAWASSWKRNSQEFLRDGESAPCGLLLPAWVPNNTEAVKVRSFLEDDTEVLTSNNVAELRAFLGLVNQHRKPISCLSAGVHPLINLLQI